MCILMCVSDAAFFLKASFGHLIIHLQCLWAGMPGKSLLQASTTQPLSKKARTVPKNVRSLGQAVAKMLSDNFKAFGHQETDCTLSQGLTLRQKLSEAKALHAAGDPAAPVMGHYYYQELRCKYKGSLSPAA